MRFGVRGLVVTVLSVSLAGCTLTVAPDARPQGASPPGSLARFYEQELSWGSCRGFAADPADEEAFGEAGRECARLAVPLDYGDPDGEEASIAVLRQPARGERIGSLLVNPGGPGASGNALVPGLAGRLERLPLLDRFDLVGFDPRGVGVSRPTLDCLTDADWERERADLDVDPSADGVARTEQENQEYANRCAERSGGARVLANMGTRDVVKDLDVLRAALGDPKLTYVGYSYGTRIGSAYAEAFPANIRALVLDGAVDPTETTVDRTVEQSKGFQEAFDAYARDCAGNRVCPLGRDPAQATQVFQQLVRTLIDEPAPAGPGRTLSYPDAITGVVQALYASQLWPVLSLGLAELASGKGTVLLKLADLYDGRRDDGTYGNAIEAFTAISCMDDERLTDPAAVVDMTRRANAAAPFRDTGLGDVAARDVCAFWPVPPTYEPHVPDVAGLPPTLVVSVTGDPATPYQAGVDLAKALGSHLLTVQGTQHTASLQGNACVDDIVTSYLVDPGSLPGPESRC